MTDHEKRLKRLAIRSWRRGIKEMDLILGRFWDAEGARLTPDALDLYETMLEENDQDLYAWVCGRATPPDRFAGMIARLQPVQ